MARKIEVEITGDSRSLERALGRAQGRSHSLERAFKGLALAGGTALAAGLAFAGKSAIDFDRSMRNVNSISKLSEKQFNSLETAVLKLAGPTGQAPKVLADGMYDIVSSGFRANQAIKILSASAKAATAGLTDTATATKAIVASLNAYHLRASQAARVSDVLFQTVNKGVLTFEELSQNIGDVLPSASALKVPLEQVGGALATITLHGVNAAEASTQVKQLMISMLKPSVELTKTFKAMGFESGQAALQQLGFTGVISELSKRADGNNKLIASWFPNVRALGGYFGLAGENLKQFTANVDAMGQRGSTAAAFAEQAKSIGVQWQMAKASITAAAIPIGQLLFPALTKATQAAAQLATILNEHMPQIRAVVARTTAAVQNLSQSLRGLVPAGSQARATGRALHGVLDALRPALAALGPLIRALGPLFRVAFTVALVAVRAFATVVAISLRITAAEIHAVTAVVRTVSPAFRAGFAGAAATVRAVGGAITATLHGITSAINGVIAALHALGRAKSAIGGALRPGGGQRVAPGAPGRPPGGGTGLAVGGFVPGAIGQAVPITAHAGEILLNPAQQNVLGGPRYLSQLFGFHGEHGPGSSMAAGGRVGKPKHVAPRLPQSIRLAEARAAGTTGLGDDIRAYSDDLAFTNRTLARHDLTASERSSWRVHKVRVQNRLRSLRGRRDKARQRDYSQLPSSIVLYISQARLAYAKARTPQQRINARAHLRAALWRGKVWLEAQLKKKLTAGQRAAVYDAITGIIDEINGLTDDADIEQPEEDTGPGPDLQAQLDQALRRASVAEERARLGEAFIGTGIFGGGPGGGGGAPTVNMNFLIPDAAQIAKATEAIAQGAGAQPYRVTSVEQTGF